MIGQFPVSLTDLAIAPHCPKKLDGSCHLGPRGPQGSLPIYLTDASTQSSTTRERRATRGPAKPAKPRPPPRPDDSIRNYFSCRTFHHVSTIAMSLALPDLLMYQRRERRHSPCARRDLRDRTMEETTHPETTQKLPTRRATTVPGNSRSGREVPS